LLKYIRETSIEPEEINIFLRMNESAEIKQRSKGAAIATRPQVKLKELFRKMKAGNKPDIDNEENSDEIFEGAEIKMKYEGYIKREKVIADKIKRLERLDIPEDIDYNTLASISTEARQKLSKIKPGSIGQAGRISGVSPSDINILLMYLGR
jgi:tRNA uridine 5-carboxymethylaminomethyl modification enzyme